MTCKSCIHSPVCFKQLMRARLTPNGFELSCGYYLNKSEIKKVLKYAEEHFGRKGG